MKNYVLRDKKTKSIVKVDIEVDTYSGYSFYGEQGSPESEISYSLSMCPTGLIWSTQDLTKAFSVVEKMGNGCYQDTPKNNLKNKLEVFCIEDNKIIKPEYFILETKKQAYSVYSKGSEEFKVLLGEETPIKNYLYLPLDENTDYRKLKRLFKKNAPFIFLGKTVKLHSLVEANFPVNKKFKDLKYALIKEV